jgi:hypothetical protein
MQGPHFEYLTRSYVAALGLEPFLYQHQEPIVVWTEYSPAPKIMTGYDFAVVYNHALYFRAPDGLSWDRKAA